MDSDTLTFLLRGGHLSMPERHERGLWLHPPLKFADVLRHLATILESERWFPREWRAAISGQIVPEGGVIERQTPTRYIYRSQRAHPIIPTLLAETTEKMFTSAEDAAKCYLQWDLHLPGDLDSWKVVV
jgi:hypothetical protein